MSDAGSKGVIELPRIAVTTGDKRFRSEIIGALESYYRVVAYESASEAIAGMVKTRPTAAVIDAFLPPMGGAKFLGEMREIAELKRIPVIAVADSKSLGTLDEVMYAESEAVLAKPFRKSQLLGAISKLVNITVERTWESLPPLQKKALSETVSIFTDCFKGVQEGDPLPMAKIEESCGPLIEAIGTDQISGILMGIRNHDDYTYVHSLRLAIFLSLLGHAMGMRSGKDGNELLTLATGGLMHDIGKAMVPLDILNKPGKLLGEEWEMMKSHVNHSKRILDASPGISPGVTIIALQHHEKLDGSGYPNGIKGAELNELARMASIVDIYGALTDRRTYKPAMPAEKAIVIMQDMNDKLDMHLLGLFKELLLDAVVPLE